MARKTEVNIFNTIVKDNLYGWNVSNEIMWLLEKKFKSSNHGKDYNYTCERIDVEDMPMNSDTEGCTKFWRVYRCRKSWLDAYPDYKPCFYLMGGHPEYPKEIIPVYIDGSMCYSYGNNLTEACHAAYRSISINDERERVKTRRESELPEIEVIGIDNKV